MKPRDAIFIPGAIICYLMEHAMGLSASMTDNLVIWAACGLFVAIREGRA